MCSQKRVNGYIGFFTASILSLDVISSFLIFKPVNVMELSTKLQQKGTKTRNMLLFGSTIGLMNYPHITINGVKKCFCVLYVPVVE